MPARAAPELFRVIDSLPVAMWLFRPGPSPVVWANAAFGELTGCALSSCDSLEEALRISGVRERGGGPYAIERLPLARLLAGEHHAGADDLLLLRPDGGRVYARVSAHPLFADDGALAYVSLAFIDITREVVAEIERDTVAARLELAVDHSPIVIWSADRDGTITLSQGAGLSALGAQSGELVGKNVFELYADHPTIGGHVRRALAGESIQYITETGEAVYDTWLTPIRDSAGDVVGVTGVSRDIRELRRLSAATIQNDRTLALGTLAASVAHEINNPLTYILSHAQEMDQTLARVEARAAPRAGAAGDDLRGLIEELRKDFSVLRAGTERIAVITRELRTFSHPGESEEVPVDVRAVVRSVLQLVGKELETTRARLVLELEETRLVAAHPARLVQVILNLVMNAAQSLPAGDGGEISVRTETRAGAVIIEVGDSGPGVPAADRERIFEPFFTTKPVGEGTGLGLFVCRNITRGYGGEISVHDRRGGGALFRVTLPVSDQPEAEPPSSGQPAPTPARSAHVLIVDDDARVSRALDLALTRAGYRTSTCASGADALERLRSHADIDLVYCDLMMRGMTGMALHDRLAHEVPSALPKIVFMTGGAHSPEAAQFVSDHAPVVVEKPFNVATETERRLSKARADRGAEAPAG